MTPAAANRAIRAELRQLLREGIIDRAGYLSLAELYPVNRWDWRSLGRWFLIFGAISFAAGAVIFAREFIHFTLEKLAIQFSVAIFLLVGGGQWARRRAWKMTGQTLELLAGFALIGLTFTLGMIYSSGSGDWPSLVLIDLILILAASYALNNPLLLILSAILFFTWFGGRSGYVSGWGAYWFGMNWPLRFVAAASLIAALGWGHLRLENTVFERYRGFAKIWISSGLFFLEMALWLLSLFGNYGLVDGPWHDAGEGELLLFNAIWAILNVALIVVGARLAFRMLIGYGATFLIIQGYTLFFAHLAPHLGFTLSSLLAGGAALWLGFELEKRRRERREGADGQ